MINNQINKLMTTTEASRYLSVSIAKIYRITSNRECEFVKLGNRCYFTQNQLDDYIKLNTVEAL